MLKMYHQSQYSGNTPEYWANSWDELHFDELLQQCSLDPLLPLFDKYVTKDALILEGGCGKGHWVAYFSDLGHKIVGLDFAQRTLAELRTKRDGLLLPAGNVNELPFADETFDVYYSGGVVEHFESGCDAALSEAKRVLKPDGKLLLSVPYYSPLRKMLTPFRRHEWRRLNGPEADKTNPYDSVVFFQYAYDVSEFSNMLNNAGLHVVETMGYSVIWGLYDLRFMANRAKVRQQGQTDGTRTCGHKAKSTMIKSASKDLLLGENTGSRLQRVTTKLMRWSAANMMMFVCEK